MPADDGNGRRLRSRRWFDNPADPAMTALYLERYMNYGSRPRNCAAASRSSASRRRVPTCRRATAITSSWRAACATASALPAACRWNSRCIRSRRGQASDRGVGSQPGVSVAGGSAARLSDRRRGADHRLRQDHAGVPDGRGDGEHSGDRAVRRTDAGWLVARAPVRIRHDRVWEGRKLFAEGKIGYDEFMAMVSSSAPSVGHCNTMGTATSMNSLAETLGMSLPGCAAIPAPYRERGWMAYETGKRIASAWCRRNLRPSRTS